MVSRTSQHCKPSENIHKLQKFKVFYDNKATELVIGTIYRILELCTNLISNEKKPIILTQRF